MCSPVVCTLCHLEICLGDRPLSSPTALALFLKSVFNNLVIAHAINQTLRTAFSVGGGVDGGSLFSY